MGQIERLSRTILTNFVEILCVGRVLEMTLGRCDTVWREREDALRRQHLPC